MATTPSRRGPRVRRQPERSCIACRQPRAKRDLVRIVRLPSGAVAVDPTGKMSGRGAYLCASRDCWERGTTRSVLDHRLHIEHSLSDQELAELRGGGPRPPFGDQVHSPGRTSQRVTTERGTGTSKRAREAGLREIEIPRTITVGELADRLDQDPVDIIKNLMRMGIMASVTQAVEFESVVPIAQFYGFQVTEAPHAHEAALGERMRDQTADADEADLGPRPPVVTILGHVDHGKTSILDAIRKADVVSGEAGGITQHIGAYQVREDEKLATFLDTPGHEAFTTLRARGAHVTDIAVLVVAADDGVMPQTVEAINHAKAGNVPIVVAINKMDVPGADPERVKRQLSEQEVLVEDWGGDVVSVPVSAKTGEGLSQLLESVLLVAEVAELKAVTSGPARGTIIEARLEANRGPVATVLVQSGTLKAGSTVVVGNTWGRVRALTDYRGDRTEDAGPAAPAEVLGLQEVPRGGRRAGGGPFGPGGPPDRRRARQGREGSGDSATRLPRTACVADRNRRAEGPEPDRQGRRPRQPGRPSEVRWND